MQRDHGLRLVLVVLGLALAGCSARTAFPGEPLIGRVQWSCAPHDAVSVELSFPLTDTAESITVNLWTGLPFRAGSRVALSTDAFSGAASICPESGDCEAAEQGWIVFTEFTADQSATGLYEVEFASGRMLSGPFEAAWSAGQPLCG